MRRYRLKANATATWGVERMTEGIREGGCGCGAARYKFEGEPIYVNNCHCRQCQQQTGSTSVVNAFIESERVTLVSGSLTEHEFKAGSGGSHFICRCSECGCALWSHYPRAGRFGLGLRVGTLDDPSSLTPDAAIFVAERMPWVTLPSDIPRFDAYYDQTVVLPPDRVARIEALIERQAELSQT